MLDKWARMFVEFKTSKTSVEALLVHDAAFNFILARPDMKKLKINISWSVKSSTFRLRHPS